MSMVKNFLLLQKWRKIIIAHGPFLLTATMKPFAFTIVTTFMPELPALLAFLVTSVILLVTPGPAVLYIVARSIDQDRRAGIIFCMRY